MSKSAGAVVFKDGTRLYFIFNNTVTEAQRPLFHMPDDAWAWDESESIEYVEP